MATTTAQFTCPKCKKSFEKQHGLNMHKIRAHGPSKTWGPNKPNKQKADSPKEVLHSILLEHPDGLAIADLAGKMVAKGCKSDNPTYIAQIARKDPDIRKAAGRGGAYFLKKRALKRIQLQSPPPTETLPIVPQLRDLTKEELIARVEILSVRCDQWLLKNKALSDAGLVLMRGLTNEV